MRKSAKQGSSTKAVAYIRVSTEKQELGPEAQRAAIESWALQAKIAVVDWYTDRIGGDAAPEEREGLLEALGQIKVTGAGLFVIAKRDRLARDVMVAAAIERAVRQAGARVVAADGIGNGDGPAEEFLRTILDGAAAYERALIRQRTKAALAVKIARGERVGGRVRYGYDVDELGRLVPRQDEQEIIRRVLALRTAGTSFRGIVEKLALSGVRSRSGKPLQLRQIQRIVIAHSASPA